MLDLNSEKNISDEMAMDIILEEHQLKAIGCNPVISELP